MKLKGIELNGTYKIIYYDASFKVYNEKDKAIYSEYSDGHWEKSKYDEKGNEIYYEDSKGFWAKWEYDEKDNRSYYKNNSGFWAKWEYGKKGNRFYYENSNGYWEKCKYNEKDKEIYFENSDGFWEKREYDEKGKQIYFENNIGEIIDERVKESTAEQEGADFYGVSKCSEKADDILFALQVMYGQPKYTYSDFQKMNLSQTEINNALAYLKKKGYNKFSFFEKY